MASTSAPYFVQNISTRTTCRPGNSTTLEAVVGGRPKPLVTWHKNGSLIVDQGRQHIYEDSGRCSLVISNTNDNDEGEYECRAKNILGQVSCFGELYLLSSGMQSMSLDRTKRATSSNSHEDTNDESEGKSGLFILIDEGSQDEENSDDLGHRESISASEQIESIIEDLTMGDGSLSLSIGKDGTFVSENSPQDELPVDKECKLFKSKAGSGNDIDEMFEDVFEDAEDDFSQCSQMDRRPLVAREARSISYSVTPDRHKDTRTPSYCTTPEKQKFFHLNLHKVAAEENLNLTFSYAGDSVLHLNVDSTKSAEVGNWPQPHLEDNRHAKLKQGSEPDWGNDQVSDDVIVDEDDCALNDGCRQQQKVDSDLFQRSDQDYSQMSREASVESQRRNTTDEDCREVQHQKLMRQRSNSDGKLPMKILEVRDAVLGSGGDTGSDSAKETCCPWESLDKIWRDSTQTESDPMMIPSDIDISNDDDVFLDQRSRNAFGIGDQLDICLDSQENTSQKASETGTMSYSRSYQSKSYSYSKRSEGISEDSLSYSIVSSSVSGTTRHASHQTRSHVSHSEIYDSDVLQPEITIIEEYVVTSDYTPDESQVGSIALREGQIVEVLDQSKRHKWLVKTRPSKYLSQRQGWILSCYLEKKEAEPLVQSPLSITDDTDSNFLSGSKEAEAAQKRRTVVKELVETEEEFVNDMKHVVNTYLKEMDNPRMPKDLRDQRDSIFLNFKEICDFHNNVLIKGVQYYAGEPVKLGKTFLRLERDFDMHSNYCRDVGEAQAVLTMPEVQEYFEEYSKRIGEIDRSLSDHLKLPVQRINDYQLLLKELIKYSSVLNEDCTDLQKALDLMLSIPQRAHDLQYINNIHGFKGNIHKLGRLLRHQDWFVVTDAEGRSKERYLFLFKSRIFVTKVKRLTDTKNTFILKDIIKLADIEFDSNVDDSCTFCLHHKEKNTHQRYPLVLKASSEDIRNAWLKDIVEVATNIALATSDPVEEEVEFGDNKIDEVDTSVEVDIKQETAMANVVNSAPNEANIVNGTVEKPHFRKSLKGTTCIHGDAATFECELVAVPPATVAWLKDNVPLTESDRVQFVSKGDKQFLIIKGTQNEDAGVYTCKGTNAGGSVSCSSQLNVQGAESHEVPHDKPVSPSPKAPVFTIRFKDTVLAENTSVRFLVKVRANPDADVIFYKNGRRLKEDSRIKIVAEDNCTFELCIVHVTKSDAGNYSCVAKNSIGESSISANVIISADKDVFQGVDGELSKGGKALKPGEQPDFKWFRDGHEVEASDRFKVLFKDEEDTLALVFQHVKPEDAGLYTCIASTTSGRISCSAELTVEGLVNQVARTPEAPKITAQLTDCEVSQGASAMLDVKVTGFPRPKISWFKDGKEIVSSERFKFLREDEESVSLVIKNVTYDDAGKYVVKAKNELGEVTTSGQLIVRAPPKFKKQMRDISVMTDESVRFDVEVEGQPKPDVTWYKDGKVINKNDRINIVKEKDDVCALIIKKAVVEDSGSYSCVASNTSGKISEFGNLTVNESPRFLKDIKSIVTKEGENIKLEVKVGGYPEPTVKWYKDDKQVQDDGKKVRVERDDRIHTLSINKVTRDDGGKITCKISNEYGTAETTGELAVNSPPQYTKKLSDLTVKEGDCDVRLEVKATGYPEPKIRWYIESMEINEKSNKFKTLDEGESHVLIIKKIDEECSGSYSCKITNEYGEDSCKAVLTVLRKPKFIEGLKDIEINENEEAIFSVKFTGNPMPTAKWSKQNQEVNVTANIKLSKDSSDGSASLTIKSVSEDASGEYQCNIQNSEGEEVTVGKLFVKKTGNDDDEYVEGTVYKIKEVLGDDTLEKISSDELFREDVLEEVKQSVSDVEKFSVEKDNSTVIQKKCRKKGLAMQSYTISTVKQSSSYSVTDGTVKMMAEYSEELTIRDNDDDGVHTETLHEHRHEQLDSADSCKLMITEVDSDSEFYATCEGDSGSIVEPHSADDDSDFTGSGKKIKPSDNKETDALCVEELINDQDVFVEKHVKKYVPYDVEPSEERDGKSANDGMSVETKDEVNSQTVPVKQDDYVEKKNRRNREQDDKLTAEMEEMDKYGGSSLNDQSSGQMIDKDKLAEEILPMSEVAQASPKFESGVKGVDVWNGENAALEAIGTGIPAPDIKWYKDGEELEDDSRVKFENDDKYHRVKITGTVPEDSGVYKCVMTNGLGQAAEEGKLNVKTALEANAPVLLKKLEDAVLIEGHPITFEAKIFANPDPDIKWFKDGKELAADGNHVEISENAIKHTYMLTLKNTTSKDIGRYSIKASNSHGEVSSEASLDVQVPPMIQEIKDKKVMPLGSVSFETKVTGLPQPKVSWTKKSKDLTASENVVFECAETSGTYTLHLHNVTPEDGGEYACQAVNVAGKGLQPFALQVTTEAPHFIKGLHDISAKRNHPVTLDVQVYGLPMPNVKWFKGEEELADGLKIKCTQTDERNFSLAIEQFSEVDVGKYICKAINQAGEAVSRCQATLISGLPEFLKGLPKEVCIIAGEPFALEAKVDNKPMPDIKWMKDGKEIQPSKHFEIQSLPDGTVSLKVESALPSDKGKYSVVACNEGGAQSSACHVSVQALPKAPSFVTPLQDINVAGGDKLKLEAKIAAHPPPIYKWLKDGKPLKLDSRINLVEEPDGSYALEIENVKPEDEGKYTLQVSNHQGEAASDANVSVLTAVESPAFEQPLKSVKATDGLPCRLEAKISGVPFPDVKWKKDGAPLQIDNDRVKAVTQPDGTVALVFSEAKPEDSGKYSCKASNPHGASHSDGDLAVIGRDSGDKKKAPAFVTPLHDMQIDEGKPFKLLAVIEGNPFPEISWKKDGEPLKSTDNLSTYCDGNKLFLEMRKASPKDAGLYECHLENPKGSAHCKSTVGVTKLFSAPTFIQKFSDLFTTPGADSQFVCRVSGFPRPDVTWYRDDVPLHDSSKYKIKRDGDICALQIKSATPSDHGRYMCKAINEVGEDACSANLGIRDSSEKKERAEPPSFLKKLGDASLIEGMTAKFTACITGYPEPDFTWFKDGHELKTNDRISVQVEAHGLLRLVIKNAELNDKGEYSLKITNRHGEAQSTARLSFDTYDERKPRDQLDDRKTQSTVNGEPLANDDDSRKKNDGHSRRRRSGGHSSSLQDKPNDYDRPRGHTDRPRDEHDDYRSRPNDTDTLRPRNKHDDDDGLRDKRHDRTRDRGAHDDYNRPRSKLPADDGHSRDKIKDYHIPRDRMPDLNFEHDKFRVSAIPMALSDKPIISKMTDRRLTLSWKPSIPSAPSIPVTYIVDMCEVPNGDWFLARSGIRGCCCEIRNLEPFRDYKFRVRVENKYGISDPSPFATAYRTKLEMTPPKLLPKLPPEFDFRPDTSPYFPKDYDIDRPLHEEYAHAPRFLRQQDDVQYGVKGQSTSVEWWVYGYPTPDVSFTFNDEKIEIRGRYEYAVARNGHCKLYLNRMLDCDVGIYECIAVNEHGEARQRMRLEIAEHPVFIMPLEEESFTVRQSGTITCRVTGRPYPDIKWYKDWHPIVSSDRVKIEWKEPDLCSLTINGVISKDAGLYSCAARNIAGVATSSAMIYTEEDASAYGFLKHDHSRVVRAHRRPMEDTYDIGDELGRGTQGIVYHAVERSTGNSYAAKTMFGKGDVRGFIQHELDIMNQLHDRYLVRAKDAYDTKDSVSLITELASGGELFESICKQSNITESDVAHYIRQILWGLQHMHDKGIAHLGLTPGDLLISRPGGDDIKICDFGLANRIIKGKNLYLEYGMPEFVAPEIVYKKPVSFGTDMWSVGVITYLLLSGISPFLGESDRETLRRIQKGHITFDSDIFKNISVEAKDFISKLLVFDAHDRMNVITALQHPWLKFADHPGLGDPLPTDRLRNYYYDKYREWVRNSACNRYYRRRPLSYAFEDPSCMVYPPGERYTPPDSPRIIANSHEKPKFDAQPNHDGRIDREHEDLNYDLGYAESTSQYQNGPDTYLLQLRDVGLPLRLREYMRVSASASPSLALRLGDTMSGKNVSVRERRRFTDLMDEEIDDEKKGELNGLKRRIHNEVSPRSETKNRIKELLPHSRPNEVRPYFREKLQDTAFVDEQPAELSCLVIGEPKPVITWYRNDVLMSESYRVQVVYDSNDRCILKFSPAKNFDAGTYKVVARNAAGETTCRARLQLGETPGRPDAPEVAQVSDAEALVTWHPPRFDGNSGVLCYSLEFREVDAADWKVVANNICHLFMVVRKLSPSTGYQFRVKPMNAFGWGESSGPSATVQTKEPGAAKVVISLALKCQQETTERGRPVEVPLTRPILDYGIEQGFVSMSDGLPSDKFNFISQISRGRFSVIVKCCHREDDSKVFAAKLLECTASNQASHQNEYDVYKSLRHEKIACLYEAFRFDNLYILIQEKLQGCDILTYLTRDLQYTEDAVARCIAQVLDALEYLHFRSIVHLDIQPDNVVLSDLGNCQVKLVDFGNARFIDKYDPPKAEKVGLLEYMAPEVYNQEDLTVQADVWGVGVLMYILLSGVAPFRGENQAETAQNINYVRYRFEYLYKEVTPESTRFLMAIFKRTPQKRPTADECLESKWLNPSDLMLKKRERTVFPSNRLKEFADEYHKQRINIATSSERLLGAFGMQLSRSNSVEYDKMTTF